MFVLVEAGDIIPADAEVVQGVASVDESAITGESAPVIRESGGDFSAVTGGTRVLSDWLVLKIAVNPGEAFIDRMIAMVEGARRQKTPNEIALTILLVALTIVFLVVTATLLPFSLYSVAAAKAAGLASAPVTITVLVALLVCLIPTTIGGLLSAIGVAGMSRMMQSNVIATSGRAVEAAGDVDVLLLDKTGTITLGNRQASRFFPAPGVTERELAEAAQLASLADETPEGRSIVVLAKQRFKLRARRWRTQGRIRALHGPDPHERRRPGRTPAAQGRGRHHAQVRAGPGPWVSASRDRASTRSRAAAARRWWWSTAAA
jgi:K+-transporting ATPase ATPase B chain